MYDPWRVWKQWPGYHEATELIIIIFQPFGDNIADVRIYLCLASELGEQYLLLSIWTMMNSVTFRHFSFVIIYNVDVTKDEIIGLGCVHDSC